MRSFCLLTSMELILGPNCSLLHLRSNDTNSLKSKKKEVVAIIVIDGCALNRPTALHFLSRGDSPIKLAAAYICAFLQVKF